tara:strand:+ start:1569 stop:1961 length:393 start_codon:yes stop_codon:yes gene_type:complete
MAHYAKVRDGIVLQVIVAEADFFKTFVDTEPGRWIQTSYNTRGGVHYEPNSNTPSSDQSKALRKNYAGIGFVYDSDKDAFYEPQPYASWKLNNTTCIWEPPIALPNDGNGYYWDESVYQSDNTKGWVLDN